nr:MAG TPA: hypothetical protein [Caudoviricetes sp.]
MKWLPSKGDIIRESSNFKDSRICNHFITFFAHT